MATDKAAATAATAAAAATDALGPRIPVRHLYLDKERELPGVFGSAVTGGGGNANQKHWFIDFLPRVGLFEIRYHEPTSPTVEVRYLPREWCSFKPL
jgi:hypothetical protein